MMGPMTPLIMLNLSDPIALIVEGARIGIVTCKACGAALALDPRDDFDVLEIHARWHEFAMQDPDPYDTLPRLEEWRLRLLTLVFWRWPERWRCHHSITPDLEELER